MRGGVLLQQALRLIAGGLAQALLAHGGGFGSCAAGRPIGGADTDGMAVGGSQVLLDALDVFAADADLPGFGHGEGDQVLLRVVAEAGGVLGTHLGSTDFGGDGGNDVRPGVGIGQGQGSRAGVFRGFGSGR